MHPGSLYGRPQAIPELSFAMSIDDPQYPFTISGSQHALATRNINSENAIVPFYQQIMQAWQVVSVVAVPLVVRNEGIGEIWLCSRQDGAFDQGDLQVAATAAGQLAGVVEQSTLRTQTDEGLRRRVDQLTRLTRLSHEFSLSRDLQPLLDLLYDEALQISDASCGSIVLFDMKSEGSAEPVVQYHSGDATVEALNAAEKLALLQGDVIHREDLERDGSEPPHAGVGSTLTVPIRYQNCLAGVIRLHAQEPGAFDPDEVKIVQSLAAQAAVAIENANLFREQQQQEQAMEHRLDLLTRLFELSQAVRACSTLAEALAVTASAIQSATGFQVVELGLYEPAQDTLRWVVGLGPGVEARQELTAHPQPWSELKALFIPEFQTGSVYIIPSENSFGKTFGSISSRLTAGPIRNRGPGCLEDRRQIPGALVG